MQNRGLWIWRVGTCGFVDSMELIGCVKVRQAAAASPVIATVLYSHKHCVAVKGLRASHCQKGPLLSDHISMVWQLNSSSLRPRFRVWDLGPLLGPAKIPYPADHEGKQASESLQKNARLPSLSLVGTISATAGTNMSSKHLALWKLSC